MPHQENIASPITLFGVPRSGTSVLFRAFDHHPDVDGCGETINLIYTTWRALEQISGVTRFGRLEKKDFGPDAGALVRHAFLKAFPSEKKEWMHKPIGVPRIHNDFPNLDPASDTFVEWYWKVFCDSFPNSRNIAILRHPLDIVISSRMHRGSGDGMWRSLKFYYQSLTHKKDQIRVAVRYSDIVDDTPGALRRICDAVELRFDPLMLKSFNKLHVPVRGTMMGSKEDLLARRQVGFSHRDEWETVKLDDAAKRVVDQYHEMLSIFGLPSHDERPLS